MGYSTGTSTGPNDLIDKLRLFLISEGWTVNGFTTVGLGYRLHVQKSAGSGGPEMYFNFRSALNEYGTTITEDNYNQNGYGNVTGLVVNGSTGYNAGSSWDKQPGYATDPDLSNYSFGCVMSPMSISAIPAYYFFAVGNSVHICVECTAGIFQFMSFGCLNKSAAGLYTGGMYFTASFSSYRPIDEYDGTDSWYRPNYFTHNPSGSRHGAVYYDADGSAGWRCAGAGSVRKILLPCPAGQYANPDYSKSQLAAQFHAKSPNFYNNIAAMCPLYILGSRSDNNYSLLGIPDGVRFLNVTNYSAGQELTYGSETWKIFNANSMAVTPLNLYCGYAFLKVV